jgi:Flp pilus assembly protein protease CpaA
VLADTELPAHASTRADVAVVSGTVLGVVAATIVIAVDVWIGRFIAIPLVAAAVIAMVDQFTGRIRNRHSIALFALTLTSVGGASVTDDASFTTALVGAAIWSVPLFVMAFAGKFGGGDFKYAASLGAMCGAVSVPTATIGLIVALLACSGAGLIAAKRAGTLNTKLHLGLPLFVGTLATIVGSLSG